MAQTLLEVGASRPVGDKTRRLPLRPGGLSPYRPGITLEVSPGTFAWCRIYVKTIQPVRAWLRRRKTLHPDMLYLLGEALERLVNPNPRPVLKPGSSWLTALSEWVWANLTELPSFKALCAACAHDYISARAALIEVIRAMDSILPEEEAGAEPADSREDTPENDPESQDVSADPSETREDTEGKTEAEGPGEVPGEPQPEVFGFQQPSEAPSPEVFGFQQGVPAPSSGMSWVLDQECPSAPQQGAAEGVLREARAGVEGFQDAVGMLWGTTPAAFTRGHLPVSSALQDRMRTDRSFRRFLEVLGRMQRALRMRRGEQAMVSRVGVVVDTCVTMDPEAWLQEEWVRLAHPQLRAGALLDLAQGGLLGVVQEEVEPADRGDLFVALDRSGSMASLREASAALVASLYLEGRRARRKMRLWVFNVGEEEVVLPPHPHEAVCAIWDVATGGGTDPQGVLHRIYDAVDARRHGEADVLLVTDSFVPPLRAELLRRIKESPARLYLAHMGYVGTLSRQLESLAADVLLCSRDGELHTTVASGFVRTMVRTP